VGLAREGIDAAGGAALAAASGLPALRVLAVARTFLLLSLPVVADFLEGMLERGERDPVGGLTIAVLLLRGLERGLGIAWP
jgi:hypothetical protein